MKNLKRILFLTVIAAMTMGVQSCTKTNNNDDDDTTPEKVWEIIVYGRPTCGLCNAFKAKLDADNVAYTFKDVDADANANSEMWQKLNDAGMGGGSVTLPVVDVIVDGVSHIFSNPDYETEVKPLIE